MSEADYKINNQENKEFQKFLEHLHSSKAPEGRSKEYAWNMLVGQLENKKKKTVKEYHLPIKTILAIAASVIILAGCWFIFRNQTFTATNGKTAHVILPDNSCVDLSAGTTIKYRPFGWAKKRLVKIEGEAFFSVVKGNEFVVENNKNKITVKGTSFNVYSRNNHFDVQCFSGKVLVETPVIKPVILTKGQAVKTIVNQSVCDTFSFDSKQPVAWKKGEFYFHNEELSRVFEEVERQFNVSVAAPELKNRYYTGIFKNDNLRMALDNICSPMGLNFVFSDSTHIEIKE